MKPDAFYIATSISIYKSRKISSMIIKIIFVFNLWCDLCWCMCIQSRRRRHYRKKCTKIHFNLCRMCDKNTYILLLRIEKKICRWVFGGCFDQQTKKRKNISKKVVNIVHFIKAKKKNRKKLNELQASEWMNIDIDLLEVRAKNVSFFDSNLKVKFCEFLCKNEIKRKWPNKLGMNMRTIYNRMKFFYRVIFRELWRL